MRFHINFVGTRTTNSEDSLAQALYELSRPINGIRQFTVTPLTPPQPTTDHKGSPMIPDLTEAELAAFMAIQTEEDASRVCDAIKDARDGQYPPDWWRRIKLSGLMAQVYARFGSSDQLTLTILNPKDRKHHV